MSEPVDLDLVVNHFDKKLKDSVQKNMAKPKIPFSTLTELFRESPELREGLTVLRDRKAEEVKKLQERDKLLGYEENLERFDYELTEEEYEFVQVLGWTNEEYVRFAFLFLELLPEMDDYRRASKVRDALKRSNE